MSKEAALALIPKSLNEIQTLADQLSKSNLLPEALRGKAADVLVSIMTGAELGLPPMSSIRGVSIINGKPVLNAATMVGLLLGSGLVDYIEPTEYTDKAVTWEAKRRGGSGRIQQIRWTIDDAKRAGLYPSRDNWRCYPREMLSSRSSASLCRIVAPDLLAGVYDPDELGVVIMPGPPIPRTEVTQSGHSVVVAADIVDAEYVETKAPIATVEQPTTAPVDATVDQRAADLVARLYEARTEDAVKALGPECNDFPRGTTARKTVAAAYKQQLEKAKLNDAQLTAPIIEQAETVSEAVA